MDVALATSAALPDLDKDDQILHRGLLAMGVDARPVIWDDPEVDWSRVPLCVIRSTWDYQDKHHQYLAWAKQVEKSSRLLNPCSAVIWNTNKTYLKRFADAGIHVVPTRWLAEGQKASFDAELRAAGWTDVVVKPTVSASGNNTFRLSVQNATEGQRRLDELLSFKNVMIQPYFSSVETEGEYSLMFVQGELTHAIQKRPAVGDFRVQEELGGSTVSYDPSDDEVASARDVLAMVEEDCLYARVDFMRDDAGRFCLSEIELVEPSMHLINSSYGSERFAQAIARLL